MKARILLIMTALLLLVIAGCTKSAEIKTTTTTQNAITETVSGASENKQLSQEVKEFKLIAKQFEFLPDSIEVNKGDKVRLLITSIDVEHGISIPEYDIIEKLPKNKEVQIDFVADKQGTFRFFCSVFCGNGHGDMNGELVVK